MQLDDIKTIGVLGSGTMGAGIAQICALAGYNVMLFDIDEVLLSKAVKNISTNLDKGIDRGKLTSEQKDQCLKLIKTTTDLEEASADLIIEAVVEDLGIKTELMQRLQGVSPSSILASNTSSLPITSIAKKLEDPTRMVGLHFFNPAHIMKLVEVVKGSETSQDVVEVAYQFAKKIGKSPVYTADSPGFIVNRVARHFYVESLKVLEEEVTSHAGIDQLMVSSGFRLGPFQLMDLIGVDANFNVTKTMFEQFHQNEKFRPSRIQQKLVDAGHWGKKSGKGFYNYEESK